MVTLQLNQNQAEVLLRLIDIATKSGGLSVAEAAVFFSNAISSQLQQPASEEAEDSGEEK